MKTIWRYLLTVGEGDQSFEIPGWGGVAFVTGEGGFANQVSVFCHVYTEQRKYQAKFKVTATGAEAPGYKYLYAGSAVCGPHVWHVWRNAVTLVIDDEFPKKKEEEC